MNHSFFGKILLGLLAFSTVLTLTVGWGSVFALTTTQPSAYSSKVQNLEITSVDTGSIAFSWLAVRTPKNAYPVVDYIIEYRTSIFGRFQRYDDGVSLDTKAVMQWLWEEKTYYIRVAAKNKKGTQGKYSNVFERDDTKIQTNQSNKSSSAPAAPRSVSAVAAILSANVTFTSPENTGKAPIQYYTITSKPENKTLKYTPSTNT